MKRIKQGKRIGEMRLLGKVSRLIYKRREQEKQFEELKRIAGVREENHELIKNTYLPIPYLLKSREIGIQRNYLAMKNNTRNTSIFFNIEEIKKNVEEEKVEQ